MKMLSHSCLSGHSMIFDRKQFTAEVEAQLRTVMKIRTNRTVDMLEAEKYISGVISEPNGTLWIPERAIYGTGRKCSHFVKANTSIESGRVRWQVRHCKGAVFCFLNCGPLLSESNPSEWWGFECEEDIIPWVLRWT